MTRTFSNKVSYLNEDSSSAVPVQIEASNYFARMTTTPSQAFQDAVNAAIYDWKQQGNWANISGLWLFCAETPQAALLSVIGDTARDATITGSLTHTASKGLSGFSSSNVLNFGGIGTTQIGGTTGFFAGFAGVIDTGNIGNFIISDSGALFLVNSSENITASGPFGPIFAEGFPAQVGVVGGARNAQPVTPAGIGGAQGTVCGGTTNYRTATTNPSPIVRLSSVAFLNSSSSVTQARNFTVTLANLINNKLGALD